VKHLGLFEGIGGFSLAARWMGWETVAWVEIDKFCQAVLKKNFPDAKGYGDIKEFDGTQYRGTIDILTGGFPCQPFSTAGKRKGTEDDRHLWPEMLRVIREVQPSFVVGENVRGFTNWSGGLVFDQVLSDLANEGYETLPFLLPASGINAPHKRERIWIIAHAGNNVHEKKFINRGNKSETSGSKRKHTIKRETPFGKRLRTEPITSGQIATDTECLRQEGQRRSIKSSSTKEDQNWKASWSIDDGRWPIESPLRGGNDGVPNKLAESALQAFGNAIIPQVALQIFKAIESMQTVKK
jgi:DNA (cytosine-5)-methyltransferase 1